MQLKLYLKWNQTLEENSNIAYLAKMVEDEKYITKFIYEQTVQTQIIHDNLSLFSNLIWS